MIRTNIQLLAPHANNISKCKSLSDYCKIFWANNNADNIIKGAVGENLGDEICKVFPNITGFTATDFRPATPDEDYYDGVDTIGLTLKEINGVQENAIRQDKAFNPWHPKTKITWDDVSRSQKLVMKGIVKPGMVCLFTILRDYQITNEVKEVFTWRVTADNYEQSL